MKTNDKFLGGGLALLLPDTVGFPFPETFADLEVQLDICIFFSLKSHSINYMHFIFKLFE